LVGGQPVEYHVCEAHLQELDTLVPATARPKPATGFAAFWEDANLRQALQDRVGQEKVAAHLLPALALALLDENPRVRVSAAFRLMALGPDARSALGALQGALRDPDERVRRAAQLAVEYIQLEETPHLMFF
jgi:hypothetical protein